MAKTIAIDFYKRFKLVTPVCGLVHRISKPKGIRTFDEDGKASYALVSDLIGLYEETPMKLTKGLYWVVDVCKIKGSMAWNQYLFIVDDEGAYPIAEYLYQTDSTWIVKAIKLVKMYFNGEELEAISPTKIVWKEEQKTTKSHSKIKKK